MFRLYPLILLITFLWTSHGSAGELETFTNEAGQSIRAELIELDSSGKTVTMRLESGLKIDALLSAFSSQDQKRIKEWWQQVQADKRLLKEDHRINFTVKLNRKSKSNGRYSDYYNYDDKTKSFFPEIIIENDELERFTGNEVRLVLLAEDLHYPERRVIVSTSTIKTDFTDRGTTYLEGTPLSASLL